MNMTNERKRELKNQYKETRSRKEKAKREESTKKWEQKLHRVLQANKEGRLCLE
jgi:hypothetical protein